MPNLCKWAEVLCRTARVGLTGMVENRLCSVTVVPWDLAALLLVTTEPLWSYVIAVPAGELNIMISKY